MRYIVDENNYITFISFTAEVECEGQTCTEYTGSVPAGYDSLEAWYLDNVSGDCFASWQIIDGQLVQAEEPRAVTPDRKPDDPNIHPAASISYDNTTSELQADNVQVALDEVCAKTVTQVEEIENQINTMESQVIQNAEAIEQRVTRSEVDNILLDYPTTTQTETLINQSAEGIELSVTQSVLQDVEEAAQEAVSGSLALYVQKNDNDQVVSMLNASADEIDITGNRIGITSNNFTLTKKGNITAKAGTIGGWTIGNNSLYTDEGYGAELNSKNGSISVGGFEILAQSNGMAMLGVGDSYVFIRDDAYPGMSFYSAGGIGFHPPVIFHDAVEFYETPSFPSALPISSGGTGATGRGNAQKNLGIITRTASVSVASNDNSTVSVDYSAAGFSSVPYVAIGLRHPSASKIFGHVTEKDTTGCTVRVFSQASGSITVNVDVIIVGT